jgi:hypothetical protein
MRPSLIKRSDKFLESCYIVSPTFAGILFALRLSVEKKRSGWDQSRGWKVFVQEEDTRQSLW